MPVPFDIERAAHSLGLDRAAAQVTAALDSNDIASVLIKGPSTAHWLYSDNPDSRTYHDIDILVSPDTFCAAEMVIGGLGYHGTEGGFRPSETSWMQESGWQRGGSPPTMIDLHRGFYGVVDWANWWSLMSSHTVLLDVAGGSLNIPDAAGCALLVVLHDTGIGRGEKTAADLERALSTFDDDVWAEAASRAEIVGALASLVLGLSRHEAGQLLADRLGLPAETSPAVAMSALVVEGPDPIQAVRAWALVHRLDRATSRREQARVAFDIVFPSAEYLRSARPMARWGLLGLTVVRVARPFVFLARTPRILALVIRGRRSARRSGWRHTSSVHPVVATAPQATTSPTEATTRSPPKGSIATPPKVDKTPAHLPARRHA